MPELFPTTQSLVDYAEVTLPSFSSEIVQDAARLREACDAFAIVWSRRAVELRGSASPVVLCGVINALRGVVSALSYRGEPNEDAALLITRLDPTAWIQPHTTHEPVDWSDADLEGCDVLRSVDSQEPLHLDIGQIWERARRTTEPLREFLLELYTYNPHKREVTLTVGTCPMVPAIIALLWFLEFGSTVVAS